MLVVEVVAVLAVSASLEPEQAVGCFCLTGL